MTDRNRIPVPPDVEGELWQGGAPNGVSDLDGFDVVFNMSFDLPSLEQAFVKEGRAYWHLKLSDAEIEGQERSITAAGIAVASYVRAGKRVLVHCTQGWNRSGVVVARALIALGVAPDTAIHLIRQHRHRLALCNPHFTGWLRKQGPSLARDLAEVESEVW